MSNTHIATLKITIETGNGAVSEIACIRLSLEGAAPAIVAEAPADREIEIVAAAPELEVEAAEIEVRETKKTKKPRKTQKSRWGRVLVVRGVRYSSKVAAAKALGVSIPTLNKRIRRGDQGYEQDSTRKLQAVIVNGICYRSKLAAGKALGCASATIGNRIRAEVAGYSYAA